MGNILKDSDMFIKNLEKTLRVFSKILLTK